MDLINQNAIARLSKKGWARLLSGHLWVFAEDVNIEESPDNGQIISVVSNSGKPCGWAFYSSESKISIRMISGPDEEPNEKLWRNRFEDAKGRRSKFLEEHQAARIIFAEGDLMPGLIVDKYGPGLVMQSFHPTVENLTPIFTDILKEVYNPEWILVRNDAKPRELEKLNIETRVLLGQVPETLEITEHNYKFLVNPWHGHKTGIYLDQSENRKAAIKHAKGRVLDCFCYQGHFSLACAKDAKEIIAIDSSQEALGVLEKNLQLNSIDNVIPEKANIFDYLKDHANQEDPELFDLIILDPPPFARQRGSTKGAKRGYLELCNRALKLLVSGGVLLIFTCSYHISADDLKQAVAIASTKCRKRVWILEEFRQPVDHPILATVPETQYLKGLALRVE